jgi:hypothetical protein
MRVGVQGTPSARLEPQDCELQKPFVIGRNRRTAQATAGHRAGAPIPHSILIQVGCGKLLPRLAPRVHWNLLEWISLWNANGPGRSRSGGDGGGGDGRRKRQKVGNGMGHALTIVVLRSGLAQATIRCTP